MGVLATEARSRSAWSVSRVTRIFIFVLAVFGFSICNNTARANSSLSGQIAGTVVDQSGASVAGASVVLFGMLV